MSRIRGQGTQPELTVRKLAHAAGLRFRLYRKDLPGSPDLVLPRWRLAVFVHGCFWHRHAACRRASVPSTRPEFWQAKFDRNQARDHRVATKLHALGWRVLVIWECECREPSKVREKLLRHTRLAPSTASSARTQAMRRTIEK